MFNFVAESAFVQLLLFIDPLLSLLLLNMINYLLSGLQCIRLDCIMACRHEKIIDRNEHNMNANEHILSINKCNCASANV